MGVPDRLTEPVGVVAQARDALRDAQDEDNGTLKRPKGCMQLTASRKALGLALRVADALFKACEQRGWPVELRDEHPIGSQPVGRSP